MPSAPIGVYAHSWLRVGVNVVSSFAVNYVLIPSLPPFTFIPFGWFHSSFLLLLGLVCVSEMPQDVVGCGVGKSWLMPPIILPAVKAWSVLV